MTLRLGGMELGFTICSWLMIPSSSVEQVFLAREFEVNPLMFGEFLGCLSFLRRVMLEILSVKA